MRKKVKEKRHLQDILEKVCCCPPQAQAEVSLERISSDESSYWAWVQEAELLQERPRRRSCDGAAEPVQYISMPGM